jgi:undecaprenyl-diphosphatase
MPLLPERFQHRLASRAAQARRVLGPRSISVIYPERWVFALMALGAGAIWAFIELSDEVIEGETTTLDESILLLLRNASDPTDPLGPLWLEEMMRDFTGLGGVGFLSLLTASVIGFLLVARKPKAALAVLVAVGGGIIISSLLKAGFDRPRPELVPYGALVYTSSFPSGHSLMSATVSLTLGAMLARIMTLNRLRAYVLAVSILITLLVGISRVYLGVHWPTDVLAGWLVGSAWALICGALMLRLQRAGVTENGSEERGDDQARSVPR